jgi:hypothetical protein
MLGLFHTGGGMRGERSDPTSIVVKARRALRVSILSSARGRERMRGGEVASCIIKCKLWGGTEGRKQREEGRVREKESQC